jgi:two-component system OmpR family response regulator
MKLLIVDDDPEIRLIATFLLQREGHDVAEAASGAEAEAALAAEHPDVVLMDVMLGEEDGVDTAAALLRTSAHALPRLIFLTGATQPAQLERMRAAGAAGIIHKPFDPATFVVQIERALHAR